jgi:hypothetical protein
VTPIPEEAVEAAENGFRTSGLNPFNPLPTRMKGAIEAAYPVIRAQVLEEVKARISAERLLETDDPYADLSEKGKAEDRAYNRAIDDCLTTLEGTEHE